MKWQIYSQLKVAALKNLAPKTQAKYKQKIFYMRRLKIFLQMQLLSTDYKFAISFSILVVVLLFRPSGIFEGKKI